jgi:hypothetical protein
MGLSKTSKNKAFFDDPLRRRKEEFFFPRLSIVKIIGQFDAN